MTQIRRVTFIVNPVAGRGKTKAIAGALKHLLSNAPFAAEVLETQRPRHGTELALQASNTSDAVIAVGGDGTVNEVAAGLVNTNAIFGVISEGSGNDFARLVNAPSRIEEAAAYIEYCEVRNFDVGNVRLTYADGNITERSFFNSLGLGFDAAVAKHVAQITWLRGIPLYGTALLQTLFGYTPHRFDVRSAQYEKQDDFFLVCIGNGTWEGGGFKVTPDALPDDGKFQVCCVTGKSVMAVVPILPFTLTGGHITKKNVTAFDTDEIAVISEKGFPVHGDGEIFGTDIVKVEVSLQPRSLRVAVARK